MKKIFVLISLFSIILILSLIQIGVSNRLSTDGVVLSTIQQQVEEYRKENIVLKEKVDNLSSYDHIASAAAEMGLVVKEKLSDVVFLQAQSLALR